MNFNSVFVLFLALFVHQFIFIYAPPSVPVNPNPVPNTGPSRLLTRAQAEEEGVQVPPAVPPPVSSGTHPVLPQGSHVPQAAPSTGRR